MRRRRPGRSLALFAALLLALAALATGCERRAQDEPAAGQPAASVVATADYGAVPLLDVRAEPGQSVMRALRGATDVDTAFGGGFVAEMLGRGSSPDGPRDWFFYVNGLASAVGADQVELADGDAVWWDHRDWGGLMDARAVVGTWPATGDIPWRVGVGASAELARREPAWRRALGDPDRAGLTVAIEDGRVTALGPDADARRPVPGARALVAAVQRGPDGGDGVLLAVAGLDAAAARAAARTIEADPSVLRLRYAVAFDGAGRPLQAGGRAGP